MNTALFFDKFQDHADKFIRTHDQRGNDRLFDFGKELGFGKFGGIVDFFDDSIGACDAIAHAGRRRDERKLKLTLETFLNDVHVQQPEEAAPEAETERRRGFGLIKE